MCPVVLSRYSFKTKYASISSLLLNLDVFLHGERDKTKYSLVIDVRFLFQMDAKVSSLGKINSLTFSLLSVCAGRIRSWYHFADYGVVVYNISGNRFCEHIGRQHKSNNGESLYTIIDH